MFCLRPNLSKDISIESFKDFYWLKEELQTFCRENGISSTGFKDRNSHRIETFLRTGGIKNSIRKTKINRNG
ncbi:SAP domain-containing protein [Peribacillus frigoritolerans]|nr:SAP domain-containing protein [Peribacillus frigoritolerans]MCU6602516.1 SAP domain-containing protein [Peribacillus frigoritolerans]